MQSFSFDFNLARAATAPSEFPLDAVIENDDFAHQMEEQYLRDLTHATEVILDTRCKVRAPGEPRHRVPATTSGGGKGGRAAAGAIRISNAMGAAVGND